jgi:uncharacterized membrane protein YsdA (DUF1294 family)
VPPVGYAFLVLVAIALLASLAGFALVALDKWAAVRGKRRTPERTLHRVELLGGWPGSLAAQRLFHHKTAKSAYRRTFVAMAIMHVVASLLLLALAAALGG